MTSKQDDEILLKTIVSDEIDNAKIKIPRVKKPRNLEPKEKIKTGRKTGMILTPHRHLENGKYDNKPNDPEYFKKYYMEVLRCPYECEVCGRVIASKSKLKVHQNSNYCRTIASLKDVPNFDDIFSPNEINV